MVFGWQDGVPWTAAAFVAFFISRVWRSVIKRPFRPSPAGSEASRADEAVRRTNRFIGVTAAGYLAAGACACIAAVVGEGQEWL